MPWSLDSQSVLREGMDGGKGKSREGLAEDKRQEEMDPGPLALVPFCFFCVLLFQGRIKLLDSEDGWKCLLPYTEPACWLRVTPLGKAGLGWLLSDNDNGDSAARRIT